MPCNSGSKGKQTYANKPKMAKGYGKKVATGARMPKKAKSTSYKKK